MYQTKTIGQLRSVFQSIGSPAFSEGESDAITSIRKTVEAFPSEMDEMRVAVFDLILKSCESGIKAETQAANKPEAKERATK